MIIPLAWGRARASGHQSDPLTADLHQFAFRRRQGFVAELIDFLRRNPRLAQRLAHVVHNGKIIGRTGKLHNNFGMPNHRAAPNAFVGTTRPRHTI
jgi:hypothetical protein